MSHWGPSAWFRPLHAQPASGAGMQSPEPASGRGACHCDVTASFCLRQATHRESPSGMPSPHYGVLCLWQEAGARWSTYRGTFQAPLSRGDSRLSVRNPCLAWLPPLLPVRTGETRGSFRGRCRALQDRLLWACFLRGTFLIPDTACPCCLCDVQARSDSPLSSEWTCLARKALSWAVPVRHVRSSSSEVRASSVFFVRGDSRFFSRR